MNKKKLTSISREPPGTEFELKRSRSKLQGHKSQRNEGKQGNNESNQEILDTIIWLQLINS